LAELLNILDRGFSRCLLVDQPISLHNNTACLMTFIASVIAKRGIALIADSLVTTSKFIITSEEFSQYLTEKREANPTGQIVLDPIEIANLFKKTTSHTKDFQEKLFEFDNFTGIATAGSARINKKLIEQIIDEIRAINGAIPDYEDRPLVDNIVGFCNYLEDQVRAHLTHFDNFNGTVFIVSNYDPNERKSVIYKIEAKEASKTDLDNPDFKLVLYRLMPQFERVVCDGQTRISNQILFGELETFVELVPHLIEKVFADFLITESVTEYSDKLLDEDILQNNKYLDDMKMYQLSELSLQQAVDLAYLLIKIEMDIQKYTKNIPTVGGVIKMAVIDDDGFRWLAGKSIIVPEH
jgi:hypothetical protein